MVENQDKYIYGYKCFNSDMTNRYGKKFELGKVYSTNGKVKFGNSGNGFHFCKNIEDTLRYFDAKDDKVKICIVRGFGEFAIEEDDYNGYYDMFSIENMEIVKILSREEIIHIALNLNELRVCRFIQCFKLNNDEIELFKGKFNKNRSIHDYIEYYQIGNKEAFKHM